MILRASSDQRPRVRASLQDLLNQKLQTISTLAQDSILLPTLRLSKLTQAGKLAHQCVEKRRETFVDAITLLPIPTTPTLIHPSSSRPAGLLAHRCAPILAKETKILAPTTIR